MMTGRPTAHDTCVTGISWLQHETQKGQPKPSIRHFQHGRWVPDSGLHILTLPCYSSHSRVKSGENLQK